MTRCSRPVELAISSLSHYLRTGEIMALPADLPPELNGRAGAFVSLKKHGQLRGCIGTFLPTQSNIAAEIIHNAVGAGTNDPRFLPVKPEEMSELTVSVDVLSEPEKINSLDDLDPRRYGVIVARGSRRGLLLPDLEGVDTVEEQVAIARQKAGIRPEEPVELYRFYVTRYS